MDASDDHAAATSRTSSVSARCWCEGQYPLCGSGERWHGVPRRVVARHSSRSATGFAAKYSRANDM